MRYREFGNTSVWIYCEREFGGEFEGAFTKSFAEDFDKGSDEGRNEESNDEKVEMLKLWDVDLMKGLWLDQIVKKFDTRSPSTRD